MILNQPRLASRLLFSFHKFIFSASSVILKCKSKVFILIPNSRMPAGCMERNKDARAVYWSGLCLVSEGDRLVSRGLARNRADTDVKRNGTCEKMEWLQKESEGVQTGAGRRGFPFLRFSPAFLTDAFWSAKAARAVRASVILQVQEDGLFLRWQAGNGAGEAAIPAGLGSF